VCVCVCVCVCLCVCVCMCVCLRFSPFDRCSHVCDMTYIYMCDIVRDSTDSAVHDSCK